MCTRKSLMLFWGFVESFASASYICNLTYFGQIMKQDIFWNKFYAAVLVIFFAPRCWVGGLSPPIFFFERVAGPSTPLLHCLCNLTYCILIYHRLSLLAKWACTNFLCRWKKGNCLGEKIEEIHKVTFQFLHVILLVDFMGKAGEICIISRYLQVSSFSANYTILSLWGFFSQRCFQNCSGSSLGQGWGWGELYVRILLEGMGAAWGILGKPSRHAGTMD